MSVAFEPAPIWPRIAAAIIDILMANIVVLTFTLVVTDLLAEAISGVILSGVYYVGTTTLLGGTPAKRLLTLWVLDTETEDLVGWQPALVRWAVPWGIPLALLLVGSAAGAPDGVLGTLILLVFAAPIIVFGSIFLREDHRGLHDLLAGSIVSHPVLDTRLG